MTQLIGLCFTAPANAAELAPLRSITVNGQAERKVVPDEAHVGVNLNSLAPKLADAKAEHDKKLKQLLAITEKEGIAEKKVRTVSSSSEPQYEYSNNQNIFRGYRVQTQLEITVAPIDKVAQVMDAITKAGFERGASTQWGSLLSVNYAVVEPDKIRDELLGDAIANARAKAEKMAKAAGAEINRVYQINETGAPNFAFPQPVMAMRAMAVADAASAPVAPPAGEQNLQASVTVTFELK